MCKYSKMNEYLVFYKKYSDEDKLWDVFTKSYVYRTHNFNKVELLINLRNEELLDKLDMIEIINVIKL